MKITKYKISIICIAILVILILTSIFFPPSKIVTDSNSGNEIIGYIKNGDVIEQTFTTNKSYNKVGIPFGTYSQFIDKGKAFVTIENPKGNKKKYKVKLNKLIDNEYHYLKYKFKKNKIYKMTIVVEKANYPIAIYTTSSNKNAELKINNEKREDNIRLAFAYKDKDYFNIWNYTFMLSIVILYAILIKNSGGKNEE